MRILTANESDAAELGEFLQQMNRRSTAHIGYCGKDADEITAVLRTDLLEEDGQLPFIIARDGHNKIQAACGFDMEGDAAEVWGPFSSGEEDCQQEVWKALLARYPGIRHFYFFIHQDNSRQQKFAEGLGAVQTGRHLILELERHQFKRPGVKRAEVFDTRDIAPFKELHGSLFPHTYYNAEQILSRLSDANHLKLMKSGEDEIQGYAYYEVNQAFGEASLEYIAVSPAFRNKGIGTALLRETLTDIFAHETIREMKLCVSNENEAANHVYVKAGFRKRDVLVSYTLTG